MLNVVRHKEVFDPDQFACPVHVIGCGGMGSRVAEGLIRMGLGTAGKNPIFLYDHDQFEHHNLTNQWVTASRLTWNKATAVADQMLEINAEAEIYPSPQMVEGFVALSGLVFMCLDSMAARRFILDEVILQNPYVSCVIETRMDATVGISHCFNPHNEKQLACWRLYWHSDQEADNIAGCGGPQSIISAIYGTTALALKQFEQFARTKNTVAMHNRVYHDFETCMVNHETWPIT